MKEQWTIRLEPEMMAKIKAISEKELRSLNNTVEFLLAKAVMEYERGEK